MSGSRSRQKIYREEEGERTKVVMQKVSWQIAVEPHFFEWGRDGGSFQARFFLIYKETGIDCSSEDWKTQTAQEKRLQVNKDISTKTIPPQSKHIIYS